MASDLQPSLCSSIAVVYGEAMLKYNLVAKQGFTLKDQTMLQAEHKPERLCM